MGKVGCAEESDPPRHAHPAGKWQSWIQTQVCLTLNSMPMSGRSSVPHLGEDITELSLEVG